MLIFLVGQPFSLSPLTGINKDQIFVSAFFGVLWHDRSFAAETVNPLLILTRFVHIPGIQTSANTGTICFCAKTKNYLDLSFCLLCKMWCTCRKRSSLNEQDRLLAQMSA